MKKKDAALIIYNDGRVQVSIPKQKKDDIVEVPTKKDCIEKTNKTEIPVAEKEVQKTSVAKIAKNDNQKLPNTGEKSGLVASLAGSFLLVGAAIFKPKRRKG